MRFESRKGVKMRLLPGVGPRLETPYSLEQSDFKLIVTIIKQLPEPSLLFLFPVS